MVIQVELNKMVEIVQSLDSTPFEVNENLVCLNTTECSPKFNRVLREIYISRVGGFLFFFFSFFP